MRTPVTSTRIRRFSEGSSKETDDILVTEEPLEIRLGHGPMENRKEVRLSVTMRTPGHDEELTLGFLYTEGIINRRDDVVAVKQCENVKAEERGNVVRAELRPELAIDPKRWQRNFYTSSSCGVCGKSSIEAVEVLCKPLPPFGPVDKEVITALPEKMRNAQTVFRHTGGIHAAALFDRKGTLLLLREDIGRHNAVDKLIGVMSLNNIDPQDKVMLVSGRAGFELVQKCAVAGISLMAAVGAPSSLSVELARRTGMTLLGFLRHEQFNSYT